MTVRSIRLLPALLTVSLILVPNIRAQQPSAGSEESTIKQAWVTNLGDAPARTYPEVLKNGGTVGFGTVIVVNPHKDAAIFIAVNKSQSNPAPLGVEIGRHLP
jgi:hypothetical protein